MVVPPTPDPAPVLHGVIIEIVDAGRGREGAERGEEK